MKAKKLLSITVLSMLPFAANAEYVYTLSNTPAQAASDGSVVKLATYGPYQIATIGNNDGEHIASTAYVKGAYNDAMAAINRLDRRLYNSGTEDYVNGVDSADVMVDQVREVMKDGADNFFEDTLVSAAGVIAAIQDVATHQVVSARDTWGSNHTANVSVSTVFPSNGD